MIHCFRKTGSLGKRWNDKEKSCLLFPLHWGTQQWDTELSFLSAIPLCVMYAQHRFINRKFGLVNRVYCLRRFAVIQRFGEPHINWPTTNLANILLDKNVAYLGQNYVVLLNVVWKKVNNPAHWGELHQVYFTSLGI